MKILILILALLIPCAALSSPVLHSKEYLVMNLDTSEVLISKDSDKLTPIASITKMMTAIVTLEAKNVRGSVTITALDVDRLKNTTSRLRIGTVIHKKMALKLALQSSENRTANALLRSYPGGYHAGLEAMNRKAKELGMNNTTFYDATGLNPNTKSTPEDLAKLFVYAMRFPMIREYSTSKMQRFNSLMFVNSNPIVRNKNFPVVLQKTGFINEAKYCVAMISNVGGNNIIMIFLNSPTPQSRFQDAITVYRYLKK